MNEFEKPRMALLPLAEYKETLERLRQLEKLCARAAEALEQFDLGKAHLGPCPVCKLIAELRKAAE